MPTPEPEKHTGAAELPAGPQEEATSSRPVAAPSSKAVVRFRLIVGLVAAVLGLVLAVVFAVRPPDGASTVAHISGVAIWVAVAGAGVSWALDAPRRVLTICAFAGVAAYVVLWFTRP